MPAKGLEKVRRALTRTFTEIQGPMTERTLTEVLIVGGGAADRITPIATSTLVNSRFRYVARGGKGWIARYGYTAAYAAAVHNASGKLKGKPRSGTDSFTTRTGAVAFAYKVGNFWDPRGEPEFLAKGFERDGLAMIKEVIRRNMKL